MEQYFSEIVKLKQENIQLKQEINVATQSIDTLQKENIQLEQDKQNKESVVTLEKDKLLQIKESIISKNMTRL